LEVKRGEKEEEKRERERKEGFKKNEE